MTETRRSYDEGCLAAHALDLIGDRWALLVVRELLLGPRRFAAIRAGLPGISANVLTQRLQQLEAAWIVTRQTLPPPASVGVYALSHAGVALAPVIDALCVWGATQPGHDPRQFISPTALMLSMRALCDRDRAGAHLVEIRSGQDVFAIRTAPGVYDLSRAEAPMARLRFSGSGNDLAAVIYGPAPLAETAGLRVDFSGDLAEGQAFLDLFALRAGGANPAPPFKSAYRAAC